MIYTQDQEFKMISGKYIKLKLHGFSQNIFTDENLKGVVLIVHGLGEHSGRYGKIIDDLGQKKFAVCTFDLPAHGVNQNCNMKHETFESFVLNIVETINYLHKIFYRKKMYLFGHSFGGLLSVYASQILETKISGLFLSSPCFGVVEKIPFWKKTLSKRLNKLLPNLKVPTGVKSHVLSNNKVNNCEFMSDPLCLKKAPLRLGDIFLQALFSGHLTKIIESLEVPVLLVYGASDKLVDAQVTKRLSNRFRNVHSIAIEGAGHEIFFELPKYAQIAFNSLEYMFV